MQKYIETTGKTEEAAIAAALEKLGLTREEVSVEVLALAKSGFLGIGGTPAKVRVSYEVPDEEEAPAPACVQEESGEAPSPAAPEEVPAAPAASDPLPEADDATAQRLREFLTGLLERMEVKAVPQIRVDNEGNYLVELVGQGLGAVIGRRGETLDAIQQLAGYAVNRGQNKRVRIRVDAEGYRAKREAALENMARRTAEKVVRQRRNITLEPMNAYERHVVHTALQDVPEVTTYSVGTEPNRRTVIVFDPDKQ